MKAAAASLCILLNLKKARVLSDTPNKIEPKSIKKYEASLLVRKLAVIAIAERTTP